MPRSSPPQKQTNNSRKNKGVWVGVGIGILLAEQGKIFAISGIWIFQGDPNVDQLPQNRCCFSVLLACPSQTTGPVHRRWWKQGCPPRLRSIFRSWGRRFFYLKERMVMSSKVLCGSWDLARLEKHTSKGMWAKAKLWETKRYGDPVLLVYLKNSIAEIWVDFLIPCLFYKLSVNTGICSFRRPCGRLKPVFFPFEQ